MSWDESQYYLVCSLSVVKLPYMDGSSEIGEYADLSTVISRMSNPLSSTSVKMTKAAIAGIDIKKLNSFIPGEFIIQ